MTVSASETLEAIAVASGYTNSAVASAAYVINLPAATPTFSVSAGTYTSIQTVTISSTTAGSTIYYTTNGTTPTTSSPLYSGPVTVSSNETLEAIAVASGYTNSTVASAVYVINLPPVANAGGPYAGIKGVVLSFNGSASSSPQSKTLTYAWDFGDGNTGTGASPTHTYSAWGMYTVKLTVTDTSNLSNTATVQVTVPNGRAFASQKAISGARVYLMAANTTGYGQASVSLLSAASTGQSDSIGAYVPTGADGSFFIAGDYSCTPGSQVYLYALGGTSGAGTNTASGLLAALGACPSGGSFAATPYVVMNEVSTIAAAYAFAGFATDATHVSSSGTSLAQLGIANAFANAANLETLSTGAALAATPSGNGTVPQAEINTLANILASCTGTGSTGSNGCSLLLAAALSKGATGTAPAETASAAINIAHNPATNLGALFAMGGASGPFSPALTSQPNNLTLVLQFTGGGINQPVTVAVDGAGNAWVSNNFGGVTEISGTGSFVSGASGYSLAASSYPRGIAIDLSGNAWVVLSQLHSVVELSPSGATLSGASGYSAGTYQPWAIAIDGSGNAWITDEVINSVFEFSSSGAALSGASGYKGGGMNEPNGIAIDPSGNVWVSSYFNNGVTKLSSAGAVLSGAMGFTGGGMLYPQAIAIDGSGDAWIGSSYTATVFSNSGAVLSGTTGYDANGLDEPSGMAIDGLGNAWIANYSNSSVTEISSAGVVLSGPSGFTGGGLSFPSGIAVDGSGNVWVGNSRSAVLQFVGAATPVVTPLAVGVKNNTLGTRP